MIHVDRSTMLPPEILTSERAEAAIAELRQRHESGDPLEFNSRIWVETRKDLRKLFRRKCAYCESRLSTMRDHVDHFRPKLRAVGLDGKVTEGYWWLAYEWDNLYLSCQICDAKYKRNRFPVKGRRAVPDSNLADEEYILLDPCQAADFQEAHLVFDDEGGVASQTYRGSVTIDVLGLNRPELVQARESELSELLSKISNVLFDLEGLRSGSLAKITDSLAGSMWTVTEKAILQGISPDRSFLAAKKQVLQSRFLEHQEMLAEMAPELYGALFEEQAVVTDEGRQEAVRVYAETKAVDDSYTIYAQDEPAEEAYFRSTKRIEKVQIKNFKCLADLTFHFPDPDTSLLAPDPLLKQASPTAEAFRESWLALIGENGTGKSAFLQAIALALMGDEERARLDEVSAADVLAFDEDEGHVKVHLTGLDVPITLEFGKALDGFRSNTRDPKVLVLGYGATRLLRDIGDEEENDDALVRIGNLFDPFARLNNVDRWLADTRKVPADQFKVIRAALMDLLLLEEGKDDIYRYGGRVRVKHQGLRHTLQQMSDGYRTVTALALDIMLVLSRKWGGIRDAEGVVLVDEIGVHLHPTWKMQIVGQLRRTFPNLQFVIATHEPLCLRGIQEGEVLAMKRDEDGQVIVVDDLPSPSDLRVDQLLTSEFFGLQSTIDPKIERLFNEYYALLAMRDRTPLEEARLEELKEGLRERKHLGDSPREELMYEVIDQLLAQRQMEQPVRPLSEIKQEAVEEVRKLWEGHLSTPEE